jgi:hypothetical protein
MKICSKCKINPVSTYHKIYCISCKSEIDLKSYHKNKEKRKQYRDKYKKDNPDYVTRGNIKVQEWIKNHPGYMNEWTKNSLKTNINHKIKHNLSERFRVALFKNSKSSPTLEILGCTIDEFKTYLENQFQEGMTWENYGLKGWHIDHIKPCSLFDLSDPEEQKKCFHYTNLQPLWWYDNLKKSAKYEG